MADLILARRVAAAFCPDASDWLISSLGCGNINDTYLVQSPACSFVLQRINDRVFVDPMRVVKNFAIVTSHLHSQSATDDFRAARLRFASLIATREGEAAYYDGDGGVWRAQTYLPHQHHTRLTTTEQGYHVGRVLAAFHRLMVGLEKDRLQDPLPGFHDLTRYLEVYDSLPGHIDDSDEKISVYCRDSIEDYRTMVLRLDRAKRSGILSIQPIHGDPKIDNFLFNEDGFAEGLLDLDTVGMGIIHTDIGDCIRSCCNPAGESGGSGDISFDLGICRAILQGYFSIGKELLSGDRAHYIFDAILAIAFELGLRFYTDHLQGNIYFKVDQPQENLAKAARQFRLVATILQHEKEIRRYIEELAKETTW